MQARLRPFERTTVLLTFGLEDNQNGDLDDDPTASVVSENMVRGASVRYAIFEPLIVGIEYVRFDTDYLRQPSGTSHMAWMSAIFNF